MNQSLFLSTSVIFFFIQVVHKFRMYFKMDQYGFSKNNSPEGGKSNSKIIIVIIK